ncbi:MAG: 2-phosphosulfolactate phosphatase [Planctomycetota bacterium]
MKVSTWLIPPLKPTTQDSFASIDIAVVIDVLRATTVATTALAAGASQILTTNEIETAHQLARDNPSSDGRPALLCGERQCRPIEGFDLGNSPGEYSPAGVAGRTCVLTTTNGTRAIQAAVNAKHVLLGCFANLTAVIDQLAASQNGDQNPHIGLVCSGTNGEVTTEDVLAAGAIIGLLHQRLADTPRFYDGPIEPANDSTSIALATWQHALTGEAVSDAESLAAKLSTTKGGRNLIAAGYESDLTDCASIDVFDVVPQRIAGTTNAFAL